MEINLVPFEINIGILADKLVEKTSTGHKRVIENLVRELKKIQEINITLLFRKNCQELEDYYCDNYEITRIPKIFHKLNSYIVPFILNRSNFDLILYPDHFLPPFFFIGKKKKVVIVHDIAFLLVDYKELSIDKKISLVKKIAFKYFLKKADTIVTMTEKVKEDLCNTLNVNSNRVHVIPLGVDPNIFYTIDKVKAKRYIEENYSIKDPFFFHISSMRHNKNVINIIKAFKEFKDRNTLNNKNHLLILAGKINNAKREEISNLLMGLHAYKDTRIICEIDDEDLRFFYNTAEAFIFPSLWEGFGLPIIESMACGCPVISSNIPPISEIIGNAGILIDPNAHHEITEAMEQLTENNLLREKIVNFGIRRVRDKFNWEKYAKHVYQVCKSTL